MLLIAALIDKATTTGWTPLHWTLFHNCAILKLLIKAGANINTVNNDGDTPLLIASCNNYSGAAR